LGTPPTPHINAHPLLGRAEQVIPRGFPRLAQPGSLEVTSDHTDFPLVKGYNCIAHAAESDSAWWWPEQDGYWPDYAPRELNVEAFKIVFRKLGYVQCNDGKPEKGYDKVVLYVSSANVPLHMARQLSDGRWTSKLGRLWDIAHNTPAAVCGGQGSADYGHPRYFFRRPKHRGLAGLIKRIFGSLGRDVSKPTAAHGS
jgi:hypothetical protein